MLPDKRYSFTVRFFYKREKMTFEMHNRGELLFDDALEFDCKLDDYVLDKDGNPIAGVKIKAESPEEAVAEAMKLIVDAKVL